MKKIRLHRALSGKEAAAIARETLASRGIKPPEPGDVMPDGTIFAGLSPDTGKSMYTTPADMPKLMSFTWAQFFALGFEAHDHKDWRLPSKAELQVLFNNRTAIGGFDLNSSYWSETASGETAAWGQRFNDGVQLRYINAAPLSVRCVR